MNQSPPRGGLILGWGIILGLMAVGFSIRPGFSLLDPTATYQLEGDMATHYLGWAFFRYTDWQFPWGAVPDYFHPIGTNIGYTDSIPLVAVVLRLFDTWLPDHFQYLGLWHALCWILQVVMAWGLLGQTAAKDWRVRMPATLLLGMTPVLFMRFPHPALCAHFLILGAFWIYTLPESVSFRRRLLAMGSLCLVSAWIHPYWSVMVLPLSAASLFRWSILRRTFSWAYALGIMLGLAGLTLGSWYGLGYFSLDRSTQAAGGLGDYSANLNTLFNSMDKGWVLPGLPMFELQYEGYGYLGAGLLLLLLFWGGVRLWRKPIKEDAITWWPLAVAAGLLTLLALSPRITVGTHVVVDVLSWFGNSHPLHVFRSTGRFIWVGWYIVAVGLLVSWARLPLRPLALSVGLWLAVVIQWADILIPASPPRPQVPTEQLLETQVWDDLMEAADEVHVFPPLRLGLGAEGRGARLAEQAAIAHKPITMGYVARTSIDEAWQYYVQMQERLQQADIRPDTLYIIGRNADLKGFDPLMRQPHVLTTIQDNLLIMIHRDSRETLTQPFKQLMARDTSIQIRLTSVSTFLEAHKSEVQLLFTHDEASAKLGEGDKAYLRQRGAQIDSLMFRGAYWAVLQAGRVVRDSVSDGRLIRLDIPAGDSFAGIEWTEGAYMQCKGSAGGELSYLQIGTGPRHIGQRGMNVYVVDSTGHVIDSAHFDTYAQSYQMNW